MIHWWPWTLGSLRARRGPSRLSINLADGSMRASYRIRRYGQRRKAALLITYLHRTPPPPPVRESWVRMQGWYRDAADRTSTPVSVSLETLKGECAELYAYIPPPVDDNIPGDEEITKAVLRLRLHHAGSPSGMRAEHLRMWLRAATREEDPNPGKWEKVFAIIQESLRGGELTA